VSAVSSVRRGAGLVAAEGRYLRAFVVASGVAGGGAAR
jgi:hypothetical protein